MTGEKAALAELGRDQEWLVTKAQEISEKVKSGPRELAAYHAEVTNVPAPQAVTPKKRRSDAGKPRKPSAPTPAPAGSITTAQAEELCALIQREFQAREAYSDAMDSLHEASKAREEFVAALTAK